MLCTPALGQECDNILVHCEVCVLYKGRYIRCATELILVAQQMRMAFPPQPIYPAASCTGLAILRGSLIQLILIFCIWHATNVPATATQPPLCRPVTTPHVQGVRVPFAYCELPRPLQPRNSIGLRFRVPDLACIDRADTLPVWGCI